MGRPLRSMRTLPAPIPLFIVLTSVLSVFTVVILLCSSHTRIINSVRGKTDKKTVRLGGENRKRVIEKVKSSLSSKALLMSKMISWRKVQDEVEEEVGEDGVVWKKTIIKGEKCRPLDFSGKILYDSDGNLLPD